MLTGLPPIIATAAPDGGEPPSRRARLMPALIVLAAIACAAAYMMPRGLEAQHLLSIEDDPVRIADRAVAQKLDAAAAAREINAALAADDSDLAKSFVDLARSRTIALDPAQVAKVDAAVARDASTSHAVESFAQGLVTGEPRDTVGLAGTVTGDLVVIGDIRDAAREGARWVKGEQVDQLVLGLACVGIAVTAATYATTGFAAPVRIGVSLAKVARRTGRLSADLAAVVGRSLRSVVDWRKLESAAATMSVAEPALAIRTAREAVKLDRAGELLRLARDTGRIEARAGTRAALDGLRVAQSPREMSRLAKLAEKEGSKTRAILKIAGRGAIMLTVAAFDLGLWVLGALVTLLGLVASLKSATERVTLRIIRHAKKRRLARAQRFAAMALHG
ncbi:MAG: hypothetical protein OJF62_000219 [Pseudolabrys sp.]|nr:hypothetical protein [Pseudolabrys sp.]